jgi:hypothetical protein
MHTRLGSSTHFLFIYRLSPLPSTPLAAAVSGHLASLMLPPLVASLPPSSPLLIAPSSSPPSSSHAPHRGCEKLARLVSTVIALRVLLLTLRPPVPTITSTACTTSLNTARARAAASLTPHHSAGAAFSPLTNAHAHSLAHTPSTSMAYMCRCRRRL